MGYLKVHNVIKLTFVIYQAKMSRLEIWDRFGIIGDWDYPMTFTIEECLEDWCEERGHVLGSYCVEQPRPEDRASLEASGVYYESGDFNYE